MMVIFLPILGWIFLGSLGRSVRLNRRITCNLQPALKRWSGEGVPAASLMPKLDSFLFEKEEFDCGWHYHCVPFYGRMGWYL